MDYKVQGYLLLKYAKAWDTLSVGMLSIILHKDLVYNSHWVFETMHGREKYIAYLSGKFETIKKSSTVITHLTSTPLYQQKDEQRPCLIIEQKMQHKTNRVAILIDCEGVQIKSIDMTEPSLLGI